MDKPSQTYTYDRIFSRDDHEELFSVLNDQGEISLTEKYLRFLYATKSLINYISDVDRHFKPSLDFPIISGTKDEQFLNIWMPRKGNFYCLTTIETYDNLDLVLKRNALGDRLYDKYRGELSYSVDTLEIKIESDKSIDEISRKLFNIFTKSCNDPSWEIKLPKLLKLN